MLAKELFSGLKATLPLFTVAPSVTSTRGQVLTKAVLHAFNPNGMDGADPVAVLVADAVGNRYDTTLGGGTCDAGAVFELMPTQGGGTVGADPFRGLVFDGLGNLYGTTRDGGLHGYGIALS